MEELLDWLQQSEGPLAYVVIGLASLVEYVFPPFPGDTVSLFSVVLAATAGYSVIWVYVSLNVGAVVGGMGAYYAGRWIGRRRVEHRPRFLRSQQARKALDAVLARFDRHGAAYLALNRFVPALRAFFFLAAGMTGMNPWKVALWGGLSACAWNGILLGVGWILGANFEQLESWVETYSAVAIGVVVLVVAVGAWRWWRSARQDAAEGD